MTQADRPPRALSERRLRWLLNFYPPFLLQRIHIVEVARGFRRCRVCVRKSVLNRNLGGTIFGGSIYSAGDPIPALLYWQIFAHEGRRLEVWLKSARVRFVRPAVSDLTLDFELSDADIDDARAALDRDGRFLRTFRTAAIDRQGRCCAEIDTEVFLGRPRVPYVE